MMIEGWIAVILLVVGFIIAISIIIGIAVASWNEEDYEGWPDDQ